MPFLLIYVTHPSKPEAARITSHLLNNRFIACANYISIESVFWWEGFLTNSDEIATIYKTRVENWEIVRTTIEALHIDKIPCIIKLSTVEANESYEKWIQDETQIPSSITPVSKPENPDSFDSLFK